MQFFCLALLLILADMCASPYLWHICRFPNVPIGIIKANLRFNREYQERIRQRLEVNPDDQLAQVTLKENQMLWLAWDSLDDCRNELFSVSRRRVALGQLLQVIGKENFEAGRMPPHIPYWRFQELR